jgi:hypothetical protein
MVIFNFLIKQMIKHNLKVNDDSKKRME